MKILSKIKILIIMMGYCSIIVASKTVEEVVSPADFLKKIATYQPHEILEIVPNATEKQIHDAVKKLALKWHPDKNLAYKTEATEITKKIFEAKDKMLEALKTGKVYQEPAQTAAPAQPASGAAQASQLNYAAKQEVNKILREIEIFSNTINLNKADINRIIKRKEPYSTYATVYHSPTPMPIATSVIKVLEEFQSLVDDVIKLKKMFPNYGIPPKTVALIADYAQFVKSFSDNAVFIPEEKARIDINERVAAAINKYEKIYGKLNVTLTPAQKEAQDRAQGTYKLTAEEEVDPAVVAGLKANRDQFTDDLMVKVLKKVDAGASPYDELVSVIKFQKGHIETILSLEKDVKKRNKKLSDPEYYAKWIRVSTKFIRSYINDPEVKLESDQRKTLNDQLEENTKLFKESFNK